MIVLNLKDGKTLKFDLEDEIDREKFNSIGRSPLESENITGIWLNTDKQCTTLPLPQRFRRVFFFCQLLRGKKGEIATGEKLVVQADDVRLVITNYFDNVDKMVRIDLQQTGKQIFNPRETVNGI